MTRRKRTLTTKMTTTLPFSPMGRLGMPLLGTTMTTLWTTLTMTFLWRSLSPSRRIKDTDDKGRNKDKAIKNPEKAKGKGPKVRIQLAGTAKSITTKPTRSEQRAQSQGNVEKMAACGEQLIKKTGITPARLKAHYKRCHDGLDPQTAGFKRREIGLCTTLVTGGAQDQLMELFGMRADHCKTFPTARMLLQNMHKTNAAFGDADAYICRYMQVYFTCARDV